MQRNYIFQKNDLDKIYQVDKDILIVLSHKQREFDIITF